ncbi:MAG: Aspartate aminotransferase [Candidatus Nomurabacteria bacterium GW2011_GWA2_43_15]|uniref:Aminotransferase n=2 Tax=Candidatus Nomuraibacteriota TaxID=1752729 RepID=A0A0G1DU02_9BACT|nr:MAG: Aspartate aminotransferase [Candidatus Nomurabacteria bacterium GW2011_GWA2_43_15]
MKSFSHRMSHLGTENAFSVIGRAKKFEEEILKPQGKRLIYLQIGEPGFDTPENINQAAIRAIKENRTHYTPTPGIPELRQAVAKKISRETGTSYLPEDVVVTAGAKSIIFYTINALIDEGDEVVIPSPAYPIYGSVAEYLGGKVVPLRLKEEGDFNLDIEEFKKSITPRTKLIILNSPQNPTGAVFKKETIEKVAEIAKKYDLWVLSDEIYGEIVHDGEHFSIASVEGMSERTIILNGCSKTYAMTGYRIGWGVTKNKEMAQALEKLACNDVSCANAIAQYAALEALEGPQAEVKNMLKEYRKRRDLLVKLVNEIKGMKCHSPEGAFYLMVNVRELLDKMNISVEELCDRIMKEANVLILPGSVFGRYGEDFVRFSYVSTEEDIIEGLARIKKFVESCDINLVPDKNLSSVAA